MYFTIKAVLRTLLLPPGSPLIVMLLGALLLRRRPTTAKVLITAGALSLWLCSTAFVADALSSLAERCPALDPAARTDAQAIVIIGGGGHRRVAPEFGGPAAEGVLLERLNYGAFLARRTGLPILISGAPGESVVMGTSLARDFGTPARWVEGESRDTYQNARFTARILRRENIRRIILVTMSTHMYRAMREFQEAGFDVTPAPSGVSTSREQGAFRFIPTPGALTRSNEAVYELLGEPARRLQSALGLRERLDKKAALDAGG